MNLLEHPKIDIEDYMDDEVSEWRIILLVTVWLAVVGLSVSIITYNISFKSGYNRGMQDAKNNVIMQCDSKLPLRIDGREFWCRGRQ